MSWDAADNAAGYKVQWRVTGSGDPLTEATTTATSYTITGLDPDTTYTVMVFGTLTGAADGTGATATVATTQLQPPGPGHRTQGNRRIQRVHRRGLGRGGSGGRLHRRVGHDVRFLHRR